MSEKKHDKVAFLVENLIKNLNGDQEKILWLLKNRLYEGISELSDEELEVEFNKKNIEQG